MKSKYLVYERSFIFMRCRKISNNNEKRQHVLNNAAIIKRDFSTGNKLEESFQ